MKQQITTEDTEHQGNYKDAIEEMQNPISRLIHNYKGWGKTPDIDAETHPDIEIKQFLNDLEILFPGRNKKYLKLAIREKLTQLNCFKWRLIAKDKRSHKTIAVWDSLQQTYFDFINQHDDYAVSYNLTRHNHPAEDIISDWVDSHLSNSIFS